MFVLRSTTSSGLFWHPTVHAATFVLGWVCITVAIYVFNGVTDVTADGANHSHRPIATRQLKVVDALYASVALAGIGLLACASVDFAEAAIAAGMPLLGWAYSAGPQFKNAPAGFAVVIGSGAALTYVGGWISRGVFDTDALLISAWISAWVGLCCASKDFSDIDGDRLAGRRTWPVLVGQRRAAATLGVLGLVASAGFVTTSVATAVALAPAVVVSTGSLILAMVAIKYCAATERARRRLPYRVFMATQYSANLMMMIFASA